MSFFDRFWLPAEPDFTPDQRKSDWHNNKLPTCGTCKGTGQDPTGTQWEDVDGRRHVYQCPDCGGFGNSR